MEAAAQRLESTAEAHRPPDALEAWHITIVNAMTGAELAQLAVDPQGTLADLRLEIMLATGSFQPSSLLLDDEVLEGDTEALVSFGCWGLADGSTVACVRSDEIPSGWLRLCRADEGEDLVWDWPMEFVRRIACKSRRVRIQQRGADMLYVQSLPGSYPIEDVRQGRPLGYGRAQRRGDVSKYWESPDCPGFAEEHLWHSGAQWGCPTCQDLKHKIYHSCDNGGGIHWGKKGDEFSFCGWTCDDATGVRLALYVDWPLTVGKPP